MWFSITRFLVGFDILSQEENNEIVEEKGELCSEAKLVQVEKEISPPEKGKGKTWLISGIIIILLAAVALGFFIYLWQEFEASGAKYFNPQLLEVSQKEAKLKKISPQEGGTISLVNEKGAKITLAIPSRALEEETEVSLVSLATSPLKDFSQDLSAGVAILPVSLKFKIPATLIFDFDPQNDSVKSSPSAQFAPSAQFEEEELSEKEAQKRKEAAKTEVTKSSAIIYTNSSESKAGNVVFLSPSTRDSEHSKITTQTSEGGTFTFDKEITAEEAKNFVNEVLNNPDSTFAQILEAWKLAQQWGFEEIDEKAKGKLREKMNEAIKQIRESCQRGKPVSKKEILDWQSLAQALGFEKEEKELDELTRGCRGYYFFLIKASGAGPIPGATYTDNISASVCGFIDDVWQGEASGDTSYTSEGYLVTHHTTISPFNFSLPKYGGRVTYPIVYTDTACANGSCYTASVPFASWLYYNGLDEVQISGWAWHAAKINYQKNCPVDFQPGGSLK